MEYPVTICYTSSGGGAICALLLALHFLYAILLKTLLQSLQVAPRNPDTRGIGAEGQKGLSCLQYTQCFLDQDIGWGQTGFEFIVVFRRLRV